MVSNAFQIISVTQSIIIFYNFISKKRIAFFFLESELGAQKKLQHLISNISAEKTWTTWVQVCLGKQSVCNIVWVLKNQPLVKLFSSSFFDTWVPQALFSRVQTELESQVRAEILQIIRPGRVWAYRQTEVQIFFSSDS